MDNSFQSSKHMELLHQHLEKVNLRFSVGSLHVRNPVKKNRQVCLCVFEKDIFRGVIFLRGRKAVGLSSLFVLISRSDKTVANSARACTHK